MAHVCFLHENWGLPTTSLGETDTLDKAQFFSDRSQDCYPDLNQAGQGDGSWPSEPDGCWDSARAVRTEPASVAASIGTGARTAQSRRFTQFFTPRAQEN